MTNVRALTHRLADLLGREQSAMADFLIALADFDRQKLWRELGHASLFYFLHRELGLSAGAAHYRKTAAELVQRFPEVITPLRDGRLCITTIVALAKVMTPQNRHEVLPRFFHLSKREAEAEAVTLKPVEAAPQREVVTRVPPAAPAQASAVTRPDGEIVPNGEGQADGSAAGGAVVGPAVLQPVETPAPPERRPDPAARPDSAEPLDAERSRLHVTVSRRFLEKLEAARDALSHARPGASAEELLEAGLDLLLAEQRKRKGLDAKPRARARPARPEHVTAQVKREAWTRAAGRCEWPLDAGGVCGSTLRLEFDHIVPRARGGASTIGNIRVLCAAHNAIAARLTFGDEWLDRFTRRSGGDQASTGPS